MVINNNYINRTGRIIERSTATAGSRVTSTKTDFSNILKEKIESRRGLKFSKHAELRLHTRNIRLNDEQLTKISEALDRAEVKDIKDALVIMDRMAFVVNVKSRTVITAVNSGELNDNVFTNIDGAVYAR